MEIEVPDRWKVRLKTGAERESRQMKDEVPDRWKTMIPGESETRCGMLKEQREDVIH